MAALIVIPILAVTGQPFERHALPPNPYTINPCLEAFQQCLDREQAAGVDERRLMYARFLGWTMIEAPIDEGRITIAQKIVDCKADFKDMDDVAELYIVYLVRMFCQDKGRTPPPSEHPSRPSFEDEQEDIIDNLNEPPKSHAAAKKTALVRDGYRCKLTGCIDSTTWKAATPQQRAEIGQGHRTNTNFCHIFPSSTNDDLALPKARDKKSLYSGGVWKLVRGFSGIRVETELNGANIHNLTNGFTMDCGLRSEFDSLDLWLEADANVVHRYNIRLSDPQGFSQLNNYTVDFTSRDPNLPLPDPRYLKLHAAICRIAHLSGAAEYVAKFDRDYEAMAVLANDGSSALILEERLARLVLPS